MHEFARLVVPALRWDDAHGFGYLEGLIDDALDLGAGGFLVEGGPREEVAALIGRLHAESRHPLLLAVPAGRGAGETIAGCTPLPPFGAVASVAVVPAAVQPDGRAAPALDVDTVRRAARLTARELRTIGANWALAPVCDVDAPGADGAGSRAASDDPAIVGAVVAEWIDACQADGVIACARNFPGGDVSSFAAAIDAGVASVMVSSRAAPAFGARDAAAATAAIVRDLLRGRLGFEGLAVTAPLDRDDAVAPAREPALAVA
ncbi:MAG TPA: glycoside hydrolase family 3 N-terminal domain-containing protein, partial [Gemmatimonadaceae bacterium]|nr:glycoside hydrolase family 3 N-terminal domain-containing protein [Gemmatimonadaceae bacterium]